LFQKTINGLNEDARVKSALENLDQWTIAGEEDSGAMTAGIAEVVKTPPEVGAATGLLEVFGFMGALVAPWLFGLLLDVLGEQSGYVAGYLMLAAIAALSCIGLLFLRLRR
jgi:MFS family permease